MNAFEINQLNFRLIHFITHLHLVHIVYRTHTTNLGYLQRKQDEEEAYNAKMKPIWDKEKAEKKAIAEKSKMIDLIFDFH